MGQYAKQKLEQLGEKYDIIREVRGIGLMIACSLLRLALKLSISASRAACASTARTTPFCVFMPAMIVTKEQIDAAINILDSVLGETK